MALVCPRGSRLHPGAYYEDIAHYLTTYRFVRVVVTASPTQPESATALHGGRSRLVRA